MDGECVRSVEALLAACGDVTVWRRLRARRLGGRVVLDVELGLRPHLTVTAAHFVSDALRGAIRNLAHARVHGTAAATQPVAACAR